MRKFILALVALIGMGVSFAVATNYQMTQGTGTTFGSLVVGLVNYPQMLFCDPTTPTQCAAVKAASTAAAASDPSMVVTESPNSVLYSAVIGATGTTAHGCSIAGYGVLGCLGQLDDDLKGPLPTQVSTVSIGGVGLFSGGSIMSNVNGLYTNLLQGNAVLSATNGIPTNQTQLAGSTLVADPCQVNAPIYVNINNSGSGVNATPLIVGTATKKIYFCNFTLNNNAAVNVSIFEATTGTSCATAPVGMYGGATAATGLQLGANSGLKDGNGAAAVNATATAGDDVCIATSTATQISGRIKYVVQ